MAGRHEQRAEVGVADAELAVVAGRLAMGSVGKSAKQIEMSIAVMTSSTTFWKVTASNVSSSRRNFSRLSEARLHEELSSDMYSEHGLEAVMRPVSGLVCTR